MKKGYKYESITIKLPQPIRYMKNANEFRIGNYLPMDKDLNGCDYCIITDISRDKIRTIAQTTWITGVLYEPEGIPLTEEWLVKFGFKHDPEQMVWEIDDCSFAISYNPERYKGFTLYVNHEYETGEPFMFVHQLQNLYFALSGEELTISP